MTSVAIFLLAAAAIIAALMYLHVIVVDGNVPWWQVRAIVDRGVVRNGREYRAVRCYVEQIFVAGGFDKPEERKLVGKLNAMLSVYHASTRRPGGNA